MIASSSSGPKVVLPGTAVFESVVLAELALESDLRADCPPPLVQALSTSASTSPTAMPRPEVRTIAGDYDDEPPPVPRGGGRVDRHRRRFRLCSHDGDAQGHCPDGRPTRTGGLGAVRGRGARMDQHPSAHECGSRGQ